jgi:transposase InsO family protein
MPQIQRVWQANLQVYGADKIWRQLNREGLEVARCTVERLMKRLGLAGVRRGKVVRTTIADKAVPCPLDRVNRQLRANWRRSNGCRGSITTACSNPSAISRRPKLRQTTTGNSP